VPGLLLLYYVQKCNKTVIIIKEIQKSTLDMQILAYLTVNWIGGNVAGHVRKVDNPECKVTSLIVDADTERCFCAACLDICVEITHFSR